MRVLLALLLAITVVTAYPKNQQRIVGGSVTTINSYPDIVALLFSWGPTGHRQSCAGTILNNRSVLTAAHCLHGDANANWNTRAGSTNANSGGVVYATAQIIIHPNYNSRNFDFDVAIIRVSGTISFGTGIQAGSIAGSNYILGDNQVVWAAGWGTTTYNGQQSEQLRHVQIWTVNQDICRTRFSEIGLVITENMLCSGWLDVGGRDQCQGDSGGPLYHNRIVVGICSWGVRCAEAAYPGVNTRVSRFTPWIQSNA